MSRLELPIVDHVQNAAQAWTAAVEAHRRRSASYKRMAAYEPPQPEPVEEEALPSWRSVTAELSRQLGVRPSELKKGVGRGAPLVYYRQLGAALLCRLSKMSMPQIARLYGFENHTTVLHGREQMRPVLDATGLDECAPIHEWVEAALPLLFVHISELRRKHRARYERNREANGKFQEGGDALQS
jgi:Bacterial dnaA protein helix-turn-helix